MANLLKKIRQQVSSRIFFDLNSNYRNTIIIAGTARSGTTWLSDIINYKNDYRYIFEPFHKYKVNSLNKFQYNQYLKPKNNNPEFLNPIKNILSGKIRNYWVDQFNEKLLAKKRLIKTIRSNLMLKWIHNFFPEIPIILLLRHPCAVANSRLKLNWTNNLDVFLSQPDLMEDYLNPFKNEIIKEKNSFNKAIFLWSIHYYIPLKQFQKDNIYFLFYENLYMKPRKEINLLFSFLNKKYDEKIFKKLKEPSVVSRKDSPIFTGNNMLSSWQKNITPKQTKRAVEILNLFELDKIYSDKLMPIKEFS